MPAVPYGYGTPVMGPLQLEQLQTAFFKNLHAPIVHSDLQVGRSCPITQKLGGILCPHDDDVQGLTATILGNGHLMQGGAGRNLLRCDPSLYHSVKILSKVYDVIVMFCGTGGIYPDQAHDGSY